MTQLVSDSRHLLVVCAVLATGLLACVFAGAGEVPQSPFRVFLLKAGAVLAVDWFGRKFLISGRVFGRSVAGRDRGGRVILLTHGDLQSDVSGKWKGTQQIIGANSVPIPLGNGVPKMCAGDGGNARR